MVLLVWRLTVTDWEAEFNGLYNLNRALFNVAVSLAGLVLVYFLMSDKPARHKTLTVITTALTSAFRLFILEAPALFFGFNYQLIFGTSGTDTALHLSGKVNKPDPVLIRIHWPDSRFSGEVAGNLVQLGISTDHRYQVDVHYDHNGFRNDQDYTQADIAVIGDSFVEAAILPREQSLVQLIEDRLGHTAVNLGQIAYGLRQELEVLERYALPLKPKLILWVLFGGNDLRDIGYYEWQLEHFDELDKPLPLKRRLFSYNAFSATTKLFRQGFHLVPKTSRDRALNHSGQFLRADGVTERVYFGQTTDPWTPHQWQVTIDTLTRANHLSMENGAEFVVIYVPRKFRVYKDHLKLLPDHSISSWEITTLAETLGTWCADNDIHFLDTSPHLEKYVSEGIHPYFIDDVHWNQLGHETATSAITDYLLSESLIHMNEAAAESKNHGIK